MTKSEPKMMDFLLDVEERLSGFKRKLNGSTFLDTIPLIPGQAIYVFNWNEDLVSYQRGIKELLGYNEEEFTRELITSYFHPDDYEIVSRFIKGGTNYCTGTPDLSRDFVMNLSFRIRKKNGEYIKILRQSAIFEFSSDNRMISNYTMLADISFLDTGNKVEWLIRAKKEVREEIEKYLHEALSNFFTDREMDVLKHLEDGTSSLQIANTLYISKNTVDTHRRNMLGKANCTNTIELISFARKNGIL